MTARFTELRCHELTGMVARPRPDCMLTSKPIALVSYPQDCTAVGWIVVHNRMRMRMSNPVAWFEIIGRDAIKLQKFYADVFNWKLTPPAPELGNYSMLDDANRGTGIGGGIGQGVEGDSRVTIYIEVDDPQAYLDKVTGAGGKMLMPVTEVTDGVTIAMFADPEGHVIGLLKGGQS